MTTAFVTNGNASYNECEGVTAESVIGGAMGMNLADENENGEENIET